VIRGAYQFHDMLLQRQLQLAGPDTTVILCSDHGFQSGERRPLAMPREPAGPAVWHRHYGIVVMAGPGIQQGATIEGACLPDIAPTILHLLGLPAGADMDGRILTGALADPAPPCTIPSWDAEPGDCGMRAEKAPLADSSDNDDHLLHHFVALGYIDDPGPDKERAAESCRIELDYNLARVYLSTHRRAEALPLLTKIVHARPWEVRFWNALAHCCLKQGYYDQAGSILRNLYGQNGKTPSGARLLHAGICEAIGQRAEALEHLSAAALSDPGNPEVLTAIGRLHTACRNYSEAETAFRAALSLHAESPLALQGLASLYLRSHLDQQALDAALEALSFLPHLPRAQLNCGIALARLGHPKSAVHAFQRLLEMHSLTLAAHRWLAALYRQELDMPAMADYHRDQARTIRAQALRPDRDSTDRRSILLGLPDIPPMDERLVALERERPLPKPDAPAVTATATQKSERIIVSGLPRSGTSLMMRMLSAGGLAAMTDSSRCADLDNPKGYFEWEPIKKLVSDPSLLDHPDLESKAVKVVSMLLPHLPKHHAYRIIFMLRPAEEILESQTKMRQRNGTIAGALPTAEELQNHRAAILKYLRRLPNVALLTVDYPELIAGPDRAIASVIEFLGEERLTSIDKMAAAIVPELYRNRSLSLDPA
jgi:tetratricopeptide (TPR) repeat protein